MPHPHNTPQKSFSWVILGDKKESKWRKKYSSCHKTFFIVEFKSKLRQVEAGRDTIFGYQE